MEYITFAIAIIGCVVGVSAWYYSRKDENDKAAREQSAIETKLDFISEDIKDTKAEIRAFRGDLNETKEIALKAYNKAEAAHVRIDQIQKKED